MNDAPLVPKARTRDLIIKELPEETLVYDRVTDKALCLNQTARLVWQSCDGKTDVTEIAKRLADKAGTDFDDRVVWLALDQLTKLELMDSVPRRPAELVGLNRRQLVRDIGAAALALPLILAIASPTAAQGAPTPGGTGSCTTPTGRPNGCPCTANIECASLDCHPVQGCRP